MGIPLSTPKNVLTNYYAGCIYGAYGTLDDCAPCAAVPSVRIRMAPTSRSAASDVPEVSFSILAHSEAREGRSCAG